VYLIMWLFGGIAVTTCAYLAAKGRPAPRLAMAILAGAYAVVGPCTASVSPAMALVQGSDTATLGTLWFLASRADRVLRCVRRGGDDLVRPGRRPAAVG